MCACPPRVRATFARRPRRLAVDSGPRNKRANKDVVLDERVRCEAGPR